MCYAPLVIGLLSLAKGCATGLLLVTGAVVLLAANGSAAMLLTGAGLLGASVWLGTR
jgi:hypothetical protein